MAYTYPLSMPAEFKAAEITIEPVGASASFRSPDSGIEQVYTRPMQLWRMTVNLPAMKRDSAEVIASFFLKLNGRHGTFLCGDIGNRTARGTATPGSGGPRTNGIATARSGDLATTGWAAGQPDVLRAGDWIQLGIGSSARLHKVLDDVASDGSGNASLSIWPHCHTAYASGTTITTTNARGVFRLDSHVPYSITTGKVYGIQFTATSVL